MIFLDLLIINNASSEYQEDEDEDDDLVASFKDTYLKMVQDHKWKLSSGEVVEDILYKKYKHSKQESLAHSWILDLGNNDVESSFSKPGWQEIRRLVPALPPADPEMAKLMSEFAVVSSAYYVLSSITSTQALTSVNIDGDDHRAKKASTPDRQLARRDLQSREGLRFGVALFRCTENVRFHLSPLYHLSKIKIVFLPHAGTHVATKPNVQNNSSEVRHIRRVILFLPCCLRF